MSLPPHKAHNLTPKGLVGIERDRFYNRLLLFGTIGVVVIVLGLVGYAFLRDKYIIPRETVAVVEGHEITGADYQARVRINRTRLVNTFQQYYQTWQAFASDPNFSQQIYLQLLQVQSALQPLVAGETTINELVDDELLKLEAAELGISISDEDIDRELQSFFEYYPDGTPTAQPTNTPLANSTLSAQQAAIVSPTPTRTPFPTATATARPATTATPTAALPTATPFTQQAYEQMLQEYYDIQASELNVSEQAIRDVVYASLLRQKIRAQVELDVPHEEEQVWARHILVETEEEAQDVLTRLNEGEDWAAIAAEVSLDTANKDFGGDLGWFANDTMVDAFGSVAFSMRVGQISEPVQTDFGWHIIQVLGHEERPLTQTDWDGRVQEALTAYIASLREKYNWEIIGERWKSITPNKPGIPPLQ